MSLTSLISIIVTLLIFGVIVLIHEFGHFIIAKKNDIMVEEFAIGMGPLIYGRQKGETLYSVRLLPIGGYCKMLGEGENVDDARAFGSKTVMQRIAVCIAGVVMNLILAYVIVAIILSVRGFNSSTVSEVMPGSPAEAVGIQAGDKIVKYNNQAIHDFDYLTFAIAENGGNTVPIVIERNGGKYEIYITPALNVGESTGYKVGIVGTYKSGILGAGYEDYEKAGFLETLNKAIWRTEYYVKIVLYSLKQLVTMNISIDNMAGFIGVGQMINSDIEEAVAENYGIGATVLYLLNLTALLSANLAVFNLLPIPALDGGRLVFLIIEGIRRKPVDPEKEGMVHFIGLVLLLALSLFITYRDILKFF